MDKAHKQTDKMLAGLENALRKQYSLAFKNIRKEVSEVFGKFEFANEMTPIERYTEAQKYERLKKIEESVAKVINVVNNEALKQVNQSLLDMYKVNYDFSAKELGVLLAITTHKAPNKTEVRQEVNQEQSPLNKLAVDNVKDIGDLRRRVSQSFVSGIMAGENANKLIKRLQKVAELKLSDVVRIARTQTTKVENLARMDVYQEVAKQGYKVVKEWVAVIDSRTRDAHKKADGQRVPIDEPFIVNGEKLMFPGDPNGSAENIINCRCTMKAGILEK